MHVVVVAFVDDAFLVPISYDAETATTFLFGRKVRKHIMCHALGGRYDTAIAWIQTDQ